MRDRIGNKDNNITPVFPRVGTRKVIYVLRLFLPILGKKITGIAKKGDTNIS